MKKKVTAQNTVDGGRWGNLGNGSSCCDLLGRVQWVQMLHRMRHNAEVDQG